MLSPSFSRSRTGFTLVELLVVIAIIAVLAGISMGAYTSAMNHARKAACAGNLRSIGVGLLAYAGDNDESFPECGATVPYNTVDGTTGKPPWTQQIEPYMGGSNVTVYRCPDSYRTIATNITYSYFLGAHAAYSQLHGFGAVKLIRMRSPSDHILAGDIAYPGPFTATDADKDDYNWDPAFNGNVGNIPIHQGTANILFADGHIENLKAFDPTTMTTVYQGPGYSYLY
jgi:prepilin-type N-terminal cleavage/methylation domain-containing protein/prepilin-type processing-associated H-X9-DG protein